MKKEPSVLVRETVKSGKLYIDACLLEDPGVVCVNNKEIQKNKMISFKILYENNSRFWLQNETWEYFFAQEDVAKIEERVAHFKSHWSPDQRSPDQRSPDQLSEVTENIPAMPETADNASDNGFGKEYRTFAELSEAERLERMDQCKSRLLALIAQKPRQERLITEALVETTQDTILHNHTALMEALNLAEDDAKEKTQNLVDSTRDIVKASSQLISANIFNDDLMDTLVSKSNGTIIQHMTRVYLKGLAFLTYYNKLVSSSSIIKKLRIAFTENYTLFYRSLLPHLHMEDLTLERVFLGGMRAIPENMFYNWAIGFMVHDIGKASAVEYHEGEGAYNRELVMEHVKVGYNSIINKTNYPREAGLIAGYHHEYYGDPSGYGFFRTGLELYRKKNHQAKQDYCISYEVEPVINFQTLAFFPAKVLEIIDVFDSLTDPNRKYRKAMTANEALAMMEEEFVNKNHKLDIILFDMFKRFINEIPSS
jgi:HD-GYP domain-containing protein (c-di-GMP phosphodiesterase class II)